MSKYNSKKTTIDGITFDSKKEAARYVDLKLLEKAGVIKDLDLQPKFQLQPTYSKNGKKVKAIFYKADFQYFDNEKKKIVVEDVKGIRTREYLLKKKIFEFVYALTITEI